MDVNSFVQTIAIYALPVLFAITLHEAAHGYVARHFGDMTAFAQGRISLNPARHIDLVGTIIVPVGILLLSKLAGASGFLFGWAKPVPVNYSALKHPKRDMMWVAAAGPASNLVMALGWAAFYKLGEAMGPGDYATPLKLMSVAGIEVNVVLMLPSLLPARMSWQYSRSEPWGFPILLVLMATGYLGVILGPMVRTSFAVIGKVFR